MFLDSGEMVVSGGYSDCVLLNGLLAEEAPSVALTLDGESFWLYAKEVPSVALTFDGENLCLLISMEECLPLVGDFLRLDVALSELLC